MRPKGTPFPHYRKNYLNISGDILKIGRRFFDRYSPRIFTCSDTVIFNRHNGRNEMHIATLRKAASA